MNILTGIFTMKFVWIVALFLLIFGFVVPYSFGDFHIDETILTWSQANYKITNGTGTAKIIVNDPDKNEIPFFAEKVTVFVYSDSFPEGITLDLYETEKDSGKFERTFSFSESRSAPNILFVREGDTAIVVYSDEPLPQYYMHQPIDFTATTLIGSTGPPLERAPVSSPRIYDLDYNSINYPVVGEQILLSSDIANGQDREQQFVWIVQITDSKRKTQALSWIDGTLNPQSSFNPTASWMPKVAGEYRAVFFVWESITNPTALSPPIELDFTVVNENPAGENYEGITIEDASARQNIIEQLRTIPKEESMKNLTEEARSFVISETLKNNQVSSILEGYTFDVECCSFSVDKQNSALNQYVGLKFHVQEKYLFVTVTYDLKDEKITAILKGNSDGFAIISVDD